MVTLVTSWSLQAQLTVIQYLTDQARPDQTTQTGMVWYAVVVVLGSLLPCSLLLAPALLTSACTHSHKLTVCLASLPTKAATSNLGVGRVRRRDALFDTTSRRSYLQGTNSSTRFRPRFSFPGPLPAVSGGVLSCLLCRCLIVARTM